MSRPVRVHPDFYARLQMVLIDFDDAVQAEVEFVGRYLTDVEETFAHRWDDLPGPPGGAPTRWVDGAFVSIPALFSVEGLLTEAGVIELRNIRIVIDPEA